MSDLWLIWPYLLQNYGLVLNQCQAIICHVNRSDIRRQRVNTLKSDQNGWYFCRRYFQKHFVELNLLYFDLNITELNYHRSQATSKLTYTIYNTCRGCMPNEHLRQGYAITFHGLVQDCSISIALAMEIRQSCTKLLIDKYSVQCYQQLNTHIRYFEDDMNEYRITFQQYWVKSNYTSMP